MNTPNNQNPINGAAPGVDSSAQPSATAVIPTPAKTEPTQEAVHPAIPAAAVQAPFTPLASAPKAPLQAPAASDPQAKQS